MAVGDVLVLAVVWSAFGFGCGLLYCRSHHHFGPSDNATENPPSGHR